MDDVIRLCEILVDGAKVEAAVEGDIGVTAIGIDRADDRRLPRLLEGQEGQGCSR